MQLFYSQTSPFARKTYMFLLVSGLIDDCELINTSFTSNELRAKNPLGKIPALVDGDTTLFDSSLICEYLDQKLIEKGQKSLFERNSDTYFATQKNHYLASGITEAAVATVMEHKRDSEQSTHWLARWKLAIEEGIKLANASELPGAKQANIASLAFVAALGYLDFRLPQYDWRALNPLLAQWYAQFQEHDFFTLSAPPSNG